MCSGPKRHASTIPGDNDNRPVSIYVISAAILHDEIYDDLSLSSHIWCNIIVMGFYYYFHLTWSLLSCRRFISCKFGYITNTRPSVSSVLHY